MSTYHTIYISIYRYICIYIHDAGVCTVFKQQWLVLLFTQDYWSFHHHNFKGVWPLCTAHLLWCLFTGSQQHIPTISFWSYEDDTFFCRYPIWINLWIKACWLYRSSCCLIQMSISILIDESFVWRILFSPDYHPVDCVSLMVVKESGLWAA